MTSLRQRALVALTLGLISLLAVSLLPRDARAEKVLVKTDNWEVYTDGRVAGFLTETFGDGPPVPTKTFTNPDGTTTLETINGGVWSVSAENTRDGAQQGKVNMMRVRSGFLGNQFGFGVRTEVNPWLKATGYIQMWAFIESDSRNKGFANPVDVRQGFARLEGPWGAFTVGRTRTLFSRGATDINVLYAHKYGVGFPNAIDSKGPTQGMVGFGVLGSGFAAGMIYGTPSFFGFQLNVGLFDPAAISAGGWSRTKYVRPEAELTFEQKFRLGKVVAFANGAYQNVYRPGYCGMPPCEETAEGFGYGARVEVGPARLGLAGHYGKGLGLSYALEQSYAALDSANHLRTFDGYYGQAMVVLSPVDIFAGTGITRVFLTPTDQAQATTSVIKYQWGINAGVVYHMAQNLHWDLEYFRAEAAWFLGEKQVLNNFSAGLTLDW